MTRARRLLVVLLLLCAGATGQAAERLVLDGEAVWRDGDPRFGGFSAFALTDGGTRLVAVSDRGSWAAADVVRDGGRLTGVRTTGLGPLLSIAGTPLEGDDADAEGMAVDPEGRYLLSFEGFHRVRRYDRIDGPATDIAPPRAFARLQRNSGLEALAMDAAGTLYAIPERSGAWDRPFPVHRLRDGVWDRTLRIPRVGRFLPTGADVGPDGRLYLLERDFRTLGGFATRVRSFQLGEAAVGDEKVLLETRFGELDNMEGIEVWKDGDGRIRVTLLADDNFFPLQSTRLAEFVLTGA